MRFLIFVFTLFWAFTPLHAQNWPKIEQAAKGGHVYWYAFGGDSRTNDFIAWVGQEVEKRHGIRITHVKLNDTSEAVTKILAERAAGQNSHGSIDLIWLNGPIFMAMAQNNLLYGPFLQNLPNSRYLDMRAGSAAVTDFNLPTGGFESPWRMARFVFVYDSARLSPPPQNMQGFLAWAQAHPGRITHPHPAHFLGATFLKQALMELAPDPSVLAQPVNDAAFATATAPLWAWYDALRPHLWRGGASYPENDAIQNQMLNDGEIDVSLSFDPASTAIYAAQGLLPETARVFVPQQGSIGNYSFVAIPFNSSQKEGAQIVANFLLDPIVQAKAQNLDILGSFSVLDTGKLSPDQRQMFTNLPQNPALPDMQDLGPTLPEPHVSWHERLVTEWTERYQP